MSERAFIPARHALVAAAVWLLLPIRSATDHWAATLNVAVATLLMLVGLNWLVRATRTGRGWGWAGVALVGGTLCYEAIVPVALAGIAVAGWRSGAVRRAAMVAGYVAATTLWMYSTSPKAKDSGLFDFLALPAGHFGAATFGDVAVIAAPLVGAGVLLAWRRRAVEAPMAAVGLMVIALGATIFFRFPIELIGIGDRVNAVTSFGTALVLAAALLSLTAQRAGVAVLVASVVMLPVRFDRDQDYAWAADQAVAMLEDAEVVSGHVNFGDCPTYRNYVTPFQGWWDAEPAAQLHFDDPTLTAAYSQDAPVGRRGTDGACLDQF